LSSQRSDATTEMGMPFPQSNFTNLAKNHHLSNFDTWLFCKASQTPGTR
jgi:hypothetical protein